MLLKNFVDKISVGRESKQNFLFNKFSNYTMFISPTKLKILFVFVLHIPSKIKALLNMRKFTLSFSQD